MQYHENNKSLIETAKSNNEYSIKHFHMVDKKYSLICRKHKIVIPKVLEKQVVDHNALSVRRNSYWAIDGSTFLLDNLHKTAH